MRSRLAALVGVAFLLLPIQAQDSRAKVQGTITDASNAVIAGASVQLLNENTGIQVAATTNGSGQYLFDFVIPGTYSVTVELQGFRKYLQKAILVQARGDVTVNAALELGSTRDSVTVEAAPVAVQFNTSTMGLTLDTKMTNQLPIIHRNPFLLATLNPATVLRSSTEQSPFHHWAASQIDVGGNTSTKNDIIMDGSPSMTTQKSSYTPPMDAVSEVNLQQNAVDAEFGHSAGGVLSVSMKSGTNEYHGSVYYFGRNPALNATANSLNHTPNLTKQHTWGGVIGSPIKKNKIFNFFSYEGWRTINPQTVQSTLPTALERNGDFSKSILPDGKTLRQIWDPFSTTTAGSTVTRIPFPNNVIPQNRIDPTSKVVLGDLYQANNGGRDASNLNNFATDYANRIKYWNFSDRLDWNFSDKLKVFGRYNQFRTFTRTDDFTGGSPAWALDGSKRHARSFSGDAVYTLNSTTLLNFRGAYNGIVDSFGVPDKTLKESDLARFWGNNTFYKPYLKDLPDIYYPGINVTQLTTTALGKGNYWYQEPNSFNVEAKMSKNMGRHFTKFGGEYRRENVNAARPRFTTFNFSPALTADTYLSPTTATKGNGWATFLLGALDNSSNIASIPIQHPRVNFEGIFFQDDFKVNSRLTLNLGIRYEYFSPMFDPDLRQSRYLDLTAPIPEFQGTKAPVIPAAANALRAAAPIYNGAWLFTDNNNPGSWKTQKNLIMPRIGMAYKLNNETAIRAGWARYIVPPTLTDGLNILGSVNLPGFDATTSVVAPLEGVPQGTLSNPFPGGLVPVTGKTFGAYTNLGGPATWYTQKFNATINDRFNISLQRQLPGKMLADVTFFMNLGNNAPYTWDYNQVDPRIAIKNTTATTASVANPFFNVLPIEKFPGQLRTQPSITVSELLRPYPQYGALTETLVGGLENRYKALQVQVQRPFTNGFNFVLGYNYNSEKNHEFYDNFDYYDAKPTYQPGRNPKQRLTAAAIYELPFGKGRKMLTNSNMLVDGVLGGWSVSGLYQINSGAFLRFGGMLATGDPALSTPTNGQWFDTTKFARLPAFTRRDNPLQYSDVKGPRYANTDLTLGKVFPIRKISEKFKFEFKVEAYNLTNSFTGADPGTDVNTTSTFGKITAQRAGILGRQVQFSGKFSF